MKRWIGLLCLFSLYSTGSLAQTAPLRFTVLTYNVHSGHSPHNESVKRNLSLIGAKLNAFDIAGVQGCFTNCELLLNASHHPDKFYFNQRPHWWNRANSGLVSLSNFPLIEVKKLFFRAQTDFSSERASKGILLMRYDVRGQILDVYNTHIQTGATTLEQATRTLQLAEMVEYIWRESPPEHLVVLHGDFDMGTSSPTVIGKLKLQQPSDEACSFSELTDRVLFRSGSNTVFKPITWEDMSDVFVDAKGQPLSDSAPIAVEFEMQLD